MLIAIIVLGLGLPILVLQIACDTAVEGYEDEAGWHAGKPVSRNLRDSLHGDRGTSL